MIVWVVYDITKNKARNRVAKLCEQAGLYRVQNSVFLGTIEENEKDELKLMIEEWIEPEEDSVYIFPMSKKALQQTVLMGQAFDKKMVTDEVKQLFF
jgi:CRISPR-associated protein Cas2